MYQCKGIDGVALRASGRRHLNKDPQSLNTINFTGNPCLQRSTQSQNGTAMKYICRNHVVQPSLYKNGGSWALRGCVTSPPSELELETTQSP